MAKNSKTYELMLKIGAKQDSSLKKACADADKNLAQLNKSAKAVGKVVAGASIAAATTVATAGVAAVKSGIDYQKQLANVSTLLTGTEAEISARTAEIGKDILKVSNDTGVETANLTDGMYQVISAFGDSKDAMSILETSAKAAAAGNATTTDSVNLLSAVMKGYKDISAESAQKVADLSFATVRLGQTSFSELASSIGKVVPLSSALNVQQEELYGVFATLTGVTGSTAEVATQYKAVLSGLMTPSKDMTASLKKLGFSTADAAIKSLGFQGTLEALKGTVHGDEQAMAKLFSSTEAQTAVLAMCGAQSENLTNKTAEMYTATGAANAAFEKQTNTLDYDIQMIKNLGANFLTEIGTKIIPYVKDLADAALPRVQSGLEAAGSYVTGTLTPAAQQAAQWVSEHRVLLIALGAGITAVIAYKVATTAMTAYNAAMAIYKVVCAASATGTFTLAGAMTALNLPMLAVVAAIGLVVAAGVLLYNNWDLVKEKAGEFGTGVVSIFKGMANGAIGFINGIIGGVNQMISAINGISLTVPSWVPVVGGQKIGFSLGTIPTIPALAAGGIATAPTTALIGEGAEPEAVLPLSKLADMIKGYLALNRDSQQSGGAGTGGDVIHFSPTMYFTGGANAQEVRQAMRLSFEEFKKLYRQLKAEEKRKGFSSA